MYDIEEIRNKSFPQSEILTYSAKDFSITGTDSIVIIRANKLEEIDPYIFYLQCVLKLNPSITSSREFIEKETRATPVTEEMFMGLVQQYIEGLQEPPSFQIHGKYIDAMKLEEEWNSISLLCETTEEVVFFTWNTTA